jgi:hypothetical protein
VGISKKFETNWASTNPVTPVPLCRFQKPPISALQQKKSMFKP